jgi:hypothetical protein
MPDPISMMSGRADESDATRRLRDDLRSADRRVRELLQEYPLTAVFLAIASGYIVGRLASRT